MQLEFIKDFSPIGKLNREHGSVTVTSCEYVWFWIVRALIVALKSPELFGEARKIADGAAQSWQIEMCGHIPELKPVFEELFAELEEEPEPSYKPITAPIKSCLNCANGSLTRDYPLVIECEPRSLAIGNPDFGRNCDWFKSLPDRQRELESQNELSDEAQYELDEIAARLHSHKRHIPVLIAYLGSGADQSLARELEVLVDSLSDEGRIGLANYLLAMTKNSLNLAHEMLRTERAAKQIEANEKDTVPYLSCRQCKQFEAFESGFGVVSSGYCNFFEFSLGEEELENADDCEEFLERDSLLVADVSGLVDEVDFKGDAPGIPDQTPDQNSGDPD